MVKSKKGRKGKIENVGIPLEMEDEVDIFHKGRDRISLNAEPEAPEDSLSEEDVDVYNLSESEDDGSDSDGNGRIADLKRQEKLLRSQLQMQQGEDSEEEEPSEEDEGLNWGTKKGAYYEQGEAEDEEALKEEEEEALLIQRKAAEELRNQDFGAESNSGEESDDGIEQVGRMDMTGAVEGGARQIEEDAPELEALLSQFHSSLKEVRSRIGPLVKEVREGKLATADGVTYLETKNLLLLQYCMHLMFYLLLKAEGKSVQQHPVISRLVEIRAFLEKIRPIDKKLQYQIEKLLTSHQAIQAAANAEDEADIDPIQFRPNPSALVSRLGTADNGEEYTNGVYRPPKLNPIAMEDDPDKDTHKRKRRAAENQARKSSRNELLRDLAREVNDAPEELHEVRAGEETEMAAKQRVRLERRAAEEEEMMMRVPLGKKELKELKAARRAGMAGGALLDDFADDVADLVKASDAIDNGGRLSQKYGADLSQSGGSKILSGDADLPIKAPLADRRAKVDNARVRQQQKAGDLDSGLDLQVGELTENEEDNEVYQEEMQRRAKRKATKSSKYSAAPTHAPMEEELVAGPRKVTKEVDQNRGLTPHRRKDLKNPRVKGRKKFEKATIRRKGQVTEVRRPAGPYAGEKTGIKARVTKSTKF